MKENRSITDNSKNSSTKFSLRELRCAHVIILESDPEGSVYLISVARAVDLMRTGEYKMERFFLTKNNLSIWISKKK